MLRRVISVESEYAEHILFKDKKSFAGETMKRYFYVLIVFLGFNSMYALADPWHGYTKIIYLYPASDAFHFLVVDGLPEYSACDNGKRFSVPLNHPNYQALISSLMMAFASDRHIRINLDSRSGAVCSPTINRVFVRHY